MSRRSALMRLTPRAPWKPLYRVQAWYFPLVYSLIGFDFILRDFMMVLFGKSDANHVYPKMSAADKITFWAGKLFFFVIMFALPLLVFPWWQVLIGFLIVMLTVGLVMGVVFQLAHISGDAEFPEPVGNPLHIENEWAVHQVRDDRGLRAAQPAAELVHRRAELPDRAPPAAAHLPPELPASRADRARRPARSSASATTATPRGARRSPATGASFRTWAAKKCNP